MFTTSIDYDSERDEIEDQIPTKLMPKGNMCISRYLRYRLCAQYCLSPHEHDTQKAAMVSVLLAERFSLCSIQEIVLVVCCFCPSIMVIGMEIETLRATSLLRYIVPFALTMMLSWLPNVFAIEQSSDLVGKQVKV